MKGYYVITFFIANIIRQTVTEPERRYACWGSFGPPVISAQCPRGTVIQVLKAGLKVKQGTGPCVYKDSDCGCEYGQPACNVDNVRERCMGRPACRLDVTQQYINTPSCNGFTDYMYIEFNCVPMGTTSLHNICVTDVTVSDSGYIRSPNYPHNYPKNRYCLCNLRTLPESTIKVSILDLDRQHQGQECSHPTLLLRHDDDQRLLCSSHNDGIREINTGRSSITVVMETDEVASSGGFWLKYEASPEAMVQMECFGEFNKANSADSKKAEIPTLYLDAQVDAERSEDVPTFNQTTQDISNESIIQSEGSIQDDDEELVAREISATLERLPDAVLLSKDDETLPNQDPEEQNIDLEDDNDEMLRKQTANAVTSQSVAKQSQKDSNTDADPELLFDEDYIDVETDLIPNDNITDEEFDSIIQTILDQIEGADGARALELPAGDKLDEELLVNIAELMANELSDDNPTAKVAPPRNSSRNPKGADPDVVPLEYDNIEELLARERLQIPDYDIPVTDGDKPKPRKFRPRRPENRAVSTNPGLQSHEDRKLALIPSDTKMNENRGRAVHQTTSVRRRRPQVTPKSRARADSKKPWWFKFTLEDDYPEMYADQEHKPKGNEVRQRPEVRTAQPLNVNRRRTGGGMDEKKIRLLQKPRQRDISFEEERMTVGQRQGVRVPPALFLNGMPGDGARAITEKDDDKNLAWSLDGQQHPNPSHPLQNPATNNRNPKGNKAADKATGKNVQQGADSEDSMTVILIAAGAIGCVLLIIVVGVLIKFAVNKTNPHRAWRRRHPPKVLRKQPYLHKHPSFGSALP